MKNTQKMKHEHSHDTDHHHHHSEGDEAGHHHHHHEHHEPGHRHEHGSEHHHDHPHGHHSHEHGAAKSSGVPVLTVRAASGLSGDMILTGLALMLECSTDAMQALVRDTGLPLPADCVVFESHDVNSVAGWRARIDLPEEHAHRTWSDIRTIIGDSALAPGAKELAVKAFSLLAEAEGQVHGRSPQEVTFHEVGALDSILDICLASALYERLAPSRFVCSPLPLGDGGVLCAHGWLPVPAPAVLHLLENVPVCGFSGKGETVTPTAIALLKAFGAEFGLWPAMTIGRRALVYGSKVFPDAPNGAIWAYGPSL